MVKGGLNSHKGIFYFLLCFFFLFSSLVFALDDWQTFQKDAAGTATQTGSGSYNNDVTHLVKTIYGNNYQPLVADIDNDYELEIVIFSRSMLQIYDKYLNITHEFAVGTLLVQPSLANYDGDSYLDIIALVAVNNINYYKAFEYNGNSLQQLQSITVGSTVSNLKCIDFNGNSNIECIYKDVDGMVHGYEYGSSSDTLNINVSGGTGSDTRAFSPPLKDIDGDNNIDAVFLHNSAITSIDKNGIKWQISGTPYTDYLSFASATYTNPSSGNSSIIITFQNNNAAFCSFPSTSCTSHINSYLANGTLSWSQGHHWGYHCYLSSSCYAAKTLTYPQITGTDVGIGALGNSDAYYYYNNSGSLLASYSVTIPTGTGGFNTFGHFDEDTDLDYISKAGIRSHYGDVIYGGGDWDSNQPPIPADLDQDGSLDFVMSKDYKTTITYFKNVTAPTKPALTLGGNNTEWLSYQKDDRNRGQQPGTSTLDLGYTEYNIGVGNDFQPLVGDADNDGENEIIIFGNNNLYYYNKYLTQKSNLSNIGTLKGQPALVQYDADAPLEIVAVVADGGTDYYKVIDGNSFSVEQIINVSGQGGYQGIKCVDFDVGDVNKIDCIFKSQNGFVHSYDAADNTDDLNRDVSNGTGGYNAYIVPPFDDVDHDGDLDATFIHNNMLTLMDKNGILWQKDVSGYIDNNLYITPVFADLDGGIKEVVVAFRNEGSCGSLPCYSHVVVWNGNGDYLWQKSYTTAAVYFSRPPVTYPLIFDYDKDGYDEIGVGIGLLVCCWSIRPTLQYYDYDGSVLASYSPGITHYIYRGDTFADMNGDGTIDWITPHGIISLDGTNFVNYNFNDELAPIPAMFEGDGCMGLVHTKSGETKVFLPNSCSAKLTILVVPLNWTGTNQQEFEEIAERQIEVFLDDTNLVSCKERVNIEYLQVNGEDNYRDWECNATKLGSAYGAGSIADFARTRGKNPRDYKRVVGLADIDNINISLCGVGATDGLKEPTLWTNNIFEVTFAHEMGHTYGFAEQYCSEDAGSSSSHCNSGPQLFNQDINYLDANLPYDCPADGSNASNGTPCCNYDAEHICSQSSNKPCCLGNKNSQGGRSFMSFADVHYVSGGEGVRAFDNRERLHLDNKNKYPELSCDGPGTPTDMLDINLLVYQNDSVSLDHIAQGFGETLNYDNEGLYNILIISNSSEILINISTEILFSQSGYPIANTTSAELNFDASLLNVRVKYNQSMEELQLYKNGSLIFSQNISSFCNNNFICDNIENYETCPLDCSLNQSDHLCLPYDDGICDPDCAIDVDPNCGLDLVNLSILNQNSTQIIYEFEIENFANQTIENITWSFHTGDLLENSTINFSLNYLEDIFIYFEHIYNLSGTYAVNVTVESGIFKDEENINVTI